MRCAGVQGSEQASAYWAHVEQLLAEDKAASVPSPLSSLPAALHHNNKDKSHLAEPLVSLWLRGDAHVPSSSLPAADTASTPPPLPPLLRSDAAPPDDGAPSSTGQTRRLSVGA